MDMFADSTEGKMTALSFPRYFTQAGQDPYGLFDWGRRDVEIRGGAEGKAVFRQEGVEFPTAWSQTAATVVASKYFRGKLGTPERESSLKQLVHRVVDTVSRWGQEDGYFASDADAQTFRDELTYMVLHQAMSFNSPVWFNVGLEERPQCSACFINSVQDTMESILELAKTEGMLFKYGSGAGVNLSSLRSSREHLSGGGSASGPVSFMKGFDAFAGAIKSGGKTRRAAKMVILNVDHPDIPDFIECKAKEEKKAWALIDAGYDGTIDGEAYASVFFQNSNNSVRVTSAFMEAVQRDADWTTRAVTDGAPMGTYKARELLKRMAEAAHVCGDPGLQFDTTINDWHTCPETDRINASNPCSEFMFLDNTSCNLASLNLKKFLREDGSFDVELYRHAVALTVTAQEIVVDRASYPTQAVTVNSHKTRPLGLGYANLGALLMSLGLPYDSEAGRDYAGALTAIMTGEAYCQSARLAAVKGVFEEYRKNQKPMLRVIRKHQSKIKELRPDNVPEPMLEAAEGVWEAALSLGKRHGFRNAQVSVLAPTGTIGFMMDCDTTGIEPEIALVKYKQLVGGGSLKIVNRSVVEALMHLGYSGAEIEAVTAYIDGQGTVEGCPALKPEHLAVFDCAFRPLNGVRSISHLGHLRMMSAVQPYISGAISKTVNMPREATVEDIMNVYTEAWRLGLKAVAIYRDGSKRTQPLSQKKDDRVAPAAAGKGKDRVVYKPFRRRLPDERQSLTHKFDIAGHEGYITVGMYEDGAPGEIFIVMAKQGASLSGLMDAFATSVSLALQYGVPLEVLVRKFTHTRFEPSGMTSNPEIRFAKSIMDYIFQWLSLKFLDRKDSANGFVQDLGREGEPDAGATVASEKAPAQDARREAREQLFVNQADAPACHDCGTIMVRNGACYKCLTCGSTSGCS
jgi:ribonucleoside-diphosphate reductase alpha chain